MKMLKIKKKVNLNKIILNRRKIKNKKTMILL